RSPSPIHVWATSLNLPATAVEKMDVILAPAEKDRASRFSFMRDRDRFIAGRGFMRTVLGHYLNAKPGRLEFVYSRLGKPALGGSHATAGLHFNLSHSEDIGLLAVSPVGALGIDLEYVRPLNDMDTL